MRDSSNEALPTGIDPHRRTPTQIRGLQSARRESDEHRCESVGRLAPPAEAPLPQVRSNVESLGIGPYSSRVQDRAQMLSGS